MSGIIGGAGSKSGVIGQTEGGSEVGTWTPAYSDAGSMTWTYNSRNGYYTRVGKMVFWYFWMSTSDGGGTAGSSLIVTGLPYVVKNATNYYGGASVAYTYNFDYVNAQTVGMRADAGGTTMYVLENKNDAVVGAFTGDAVDATDCRLIASGHYLTD